MPPAQKRLLHGLKLGTKPLLHRLASHVEAPGLELSPTTMGKAQEVERFRLTLPATLPIVGGEPSELDQSRLVGMQGQAELRKAIPQVVQEPFGLVTMLEPQDEIVRVAYDDDVALCGSLSPLLDPQVEDVVEEHIC
jgi:hypothetical protein